MDTYLIFFIVTSFINVILSTFKSIFTINSTPLKAALISVLAYTWNAAVVKQLVSFDLLTTLLVVASTNLVGVALGKWVIGKTQKDRLWKVEATVHMSYAKLLSNELELANIQFTTSKVHRTGKPEFMNFGIYSSNTNQSKIIRGLLKKTHAKYIVLETRSF